MAQNNRQPYPNVAHNVASHFIFYIVGRNNEKFSGLIQDAATVQVILINEKSFRAIKISEGLVWVICCYS